MVRERTLRQVGGSIGATIPKDMAERLRLEIGDRILAVETDRGILGGFNRSSQYLDIRYTDRLLKAGVAQAQPVTTLDAREESCAATASPLLILGTNHMANPGQDAVNITADDPRSPRPQKELSALLDRLEWFAPTKVAVEGVFGRTPWLARYRDYVKGSYTLGTNESEALRGIVWVNFTDYRSAGAVAAYT